MKSKILVISVLSLFLSSGCTSSQTEGDVASAEVTDESLEMAEAVDNNSDLNMDLDGGDDAFADLGDGLDSSTPSELALSDETIPTLDETPALTPDDLSETPLAENTTGEAPLDELAPDFGAPLDDTSVADNALEESSPDFGAPIESAEADFGEATPEPTYSEPESYVAEESPKTIELKKMIAAPYMHAGKPVNGLYMAREGDTLPSISQKIFGGDRVDELCSINAYNCSRSLKVGDKYYYNSPQRPNDTETVKTFYEDAGVPAQTYITQEGDNIRDLGSKLLGNKRSWMELWATNLNVESKQELPAGTALRYWPSAPDVVVPSLAQNESPESDMTEPTEVADLPPVPDMPAMPAEENMALNDIPDVAQDQQEPMDDFAQNDAAGAMGSIEPPPPPPPPPPMDSAPPVADMSANNNQLEDPNQTMALGVGAILLLAGVALFIAIRKRRARRPVDFNTSTHTQIE